MIRTSTPFPISRYLLVLLMSALACIGVTAAAADAIVVDAATREPLGGASVFGRDGKIIGMCSPEGMLPYIPDEIYPVTIRYLGFIEQVVPTADADTVFMQEAFKALPEVLVESRRNRVLHMLAYVREYSTLSSYADTVFLFREKIVDYMLPDKNRRFKGWSSPRVLKCKSYYRFTNQHGLDSVSDQYDRHFSWSDWIGITGAPGLPSGLRNMECATDTIHGRYGVTEVWARDNDRISVDVNVLADTASRKWVPNLSSFFRQNLDFEKFRIRFDYGNVAGDSILPVDLTGYSFNIESNGRGQTMALSNKIDESFFVSTCTEVYIVDRTFITVKDAKKWENFKVSSDEIPISGATVAPELSPSTKILVDRVNNIDKDKIRLAIPPDYRLVGRKWSKRKSPVVM